MKKIFKKINRKREKLFFRRIGMLFLFILMLTALEITFISSRFQSGLDNPFLNNISNISTLVVNRYYSPLFDFLTYASLWTEIGEISSIGQPTQYGEQILSLAKSFSFLSSLSILDSENRELIILKDSSGQFYWEETSPGSKTSLIFKDAGR